MSSIGKPERVTQNRVIALFCDELGYRNLGDWTYRDGNSNVEVELLTAYLDKRGYSKAQIARTLDRLHTEAGKTRIVASTTTTRQFTACCAMAFRCR